MPVANSNLYRKRDDGTTEIVTRKGDVFLIDSEDETIARKHCWIKHENGYARAVKRTPKGMKTVYLHRLLCETSESEPHVDHKNGVPADCRRSNLRPCNRAQNMSNQKIRADNTSGFKGVGIHPQTGKFRARVKLNGRRVEMHGFDSAEAAFLAVNSARAAMHGEFARNQ